jgi:hypothetical protein
MSGDPEQATFSSHQQILLLLTYAEVFGGDPPPKAEFQKRLAGFPKGALARLCAILNALLAQNASPEPFNRDAHSGLVKAYFPSNMSNRILQSSRVVFHRQQLLFVAKEGMRYGSPDESLAIDNHALGELFLIANDHMHFDTADGPPNTLDSFIKIASALLPVQEAANRNARHKILRSYQMTSIAPSLAASKPYFDLDALFEAKTGLGISEFYALSLGALSRFHTFDPEHFQGNPSSYSLDEQWFASTSVSAEKIQAFFALTSATTEQYSIQVTGNRGANDFTAFRDKPLLRADSRLDLIDFQFLPEKFESGPFWEIHSSLSEKERKAFHSFWGKVFEKYIAGLLLKAADGKLNRVFLAPSFAQTAEELSDIVIMCGRVAVLIEAKGTTFTAKAKYEGDRNLLRNELETKLIESPDRPQAVTQLARNIERAFGESRVPVDGLDLRYVSKVFPIIVTRDDLGGVTGVNGFLGVRFDQILVRKGIFVSVAPLICMSSQNAEGLSAFLSDTSLADILEAHIQANRTGHARYVTKPLFTIPNSSLTKRGERPIPNQNGGFEAFLEECLKQLGIEPHAPS